MLGLLREPKKLCVCVVLWLPGRNANTYTHRDTHQTRIRYTPPPQKKRGGNNKKTSMNWLRICESPFCNTNSQLPKKAPKEATSVEWAETPLPPSSSPSRASA